MQIDYHLPSLGCIPLISIVGHIHSLAHPMEETIPALLPNLHLRLRGRSFYQFGDGPMREAPRAALIGVTSAAFRMRMSADYEMVCIGIMPEGWLRAFKASAAAFADTAVDAASIWPAGSVDALWHAVAEASSLAARRDRLEAFLKARAGLCGDPRRLLAVRQWIEQPGPMQLDALASRLALSPRQIARVTLDSFGLSPKTLAMKYRALRVAGALATSSVADAEAALMAYADQSHLIRDFNRFVGWTPGRFVRERQPIARATIHQRWRAGACSAMTLLT